MRVVSGRRAPRRRGLIAGSGAATGRARMERGREEGREMSGRFAAGLFEISGREPGHRAEPDAVARRAFPSGKRRGPEKKFRSGG